MRELTKAGLAAVIILGLSGCSQVREIIPGGHSQVGPVISGGFSNDGAGRHLDPDAIRDAVPRAEPRSKGGNKNPYKVNGRLYYVLDDAIGYTARGKASWYGSKFHGNLTANGERYDMYGMTAAHRSLPLPSYVRVTNLDNNRSVVVRVNDRGPFIDDRLIDLSYAAAVKLGMIKTGTINVEVSVIDTGARKAMGETNMRTARTPMPVAKPSSPNNVMLSSSRVVDAARSLGKPSSTERFINLGRFKELNLAQNYFAKMRQNLSGVVLHGGPRHGYNVRMGPLPSAAVGATALTRVRAMGVSAAAVEVVPVTQLVCVAGC